MNEQQTPETDLSMKEARASLASVASDIKTAATNKFDEAATEARSRADHAKSDVADEVKDVAMALRRASEDLRGGSAQERTLGMIASGLADVSESIRDKDLGEMVQMASRVARKNPMLFLGGAALLGFAVSRYAKASGDGKAAEIKTQVDHFMNEGNPNTQTVSAAT